MSERSESQVRIRGNHQFLFLSLIPILVIFIVAWFFPLKLNLRSNSVRAKRPFLREPTVVEPVMSVEEARSLLRKRPLFLSYSLTDIFIVGVTQIVSFSILTLLPVYIYTLSLSGDSFKGEFSQVLMDCSPLFLLMLCVFLYMRRKIHRLSCKFKISEDGIEKLKRGEAPVFLNWSEMGYPKSDILREEIQIRGKGGYPLIVIDRSLDEILFVSDIVYSMLRPEAADTEK